MENADNSFRHQYMMLSRLQSDCEYFLGHGNGCVKYLYYDTPEEHIKEMKNLWNMLEPKPEWLSMVKIEEYDQRMLGLVANEAEGDVV